MWCYIMCTTSTTNTTNCGAVKRAVLLGMEIKYEFYRKFLKYSEKWGKIKHLPHWGKSGVKSGVYICWRLFINFGIIYTN